MYNNIVLLFRENPIARAYLNLIIEKNLNINIIYYGRYSKFSFIRNYSYLHNNYWPIKLLKNDKVLKLTNKIEDYFNLPKYFIKKMYNYENINKVKNLAYINCNSINSKKLKKKVENLDNKNFLISHQEIVKDLIKLKKNIFHIHPGYLPEIKGADASLHSINKFDEVGATFFKLNAKIDEGKIIRRIKKKFKRFTFESNLFTTQDLYRIWYSFFDPCLRVEMLNNLYNGKYSNNKGLYNHYKTGNYFSFMNNNERTLTFKKIFKNNND
jgi:hypothetical protein